MRRLCLGLLLDHCLFSLLQFVDILRYVLFLSLTDFDGVLEVLRELLHFLTLVAVLDQWLGLIDRRLHRTDGNAVALGALALRSWIRARHLSLAVDLIYN